MKIGRMIATPELRWFNGVLQQRWIVKSDGEEDRLEWHDVPDVSPADRPNGEDRNA